MVSLLNARFRAVHARRGFVVKMRAIDLDASQACLRRPASQIKSRSQFQLSTVPTRLVGVAKLAARAIVGHAIFARTHKKTGAG
jgi:hypothetical protein